MIVTDECDINVLSEYILKCK